MDSKLKPLIPGNGSFTSPKGHPPPPRSLQDTLLPLSRDAQKEVSAPTVSSHRGPTGHPAPQHQRHQGRGKGRWAGPPSSCILTLIMQQLLFLEKQKLAHTERGKGNACISPGGTRRGHPHRPEMQTLSRTRGTECRLSFSPAPTSGAETKDTARLKGNRPGLGPHTNAGGYQTSTQCLFLSGQKSALAEERP